MASMPEPVPGGSPQFASGIRLSLSLKGQTVQDFAFDKNEITVGRDPYCDVYVDNPGVSRQHFRIDRGDTGEYRVTDLESSNGTYLNDRPVKVGTLRDGDVIQFGKYSVKVGIDELIGGAGASPRRQDADEGATMMLSPSEVRQMVAEARQSPPPGRPALSVIQSSPEPSLPAPVSSSNGWVLWAALAVAAAAVAGYFIFFR